TKLGRRRLVPAAHPLVLPIIVELRLDRRVTLHNRRTWALHVLGLSGWRLAEEQRHPDRSLAAVAAGGRSLDRGRHRPPCAHLGEALGPCAGMGGPRYCRGTLVHAREAARGGEAGSAACQGRTPGGLGYRRPAGLPSSPESQIFAATARWRERMERSAFPLRRIFDDRAGLAAARNVRPYLIQIYARDMGNGVTVVMREIDAPIRVFGKHWGGFRS